MENKQYKESYKTAEGRALYVLAMKTFNSLNGLARVFNLNRQAMHNYTMNGIPTKYAGYLGRKYGFHSGILSYSSYLETGPNKPLMYVELFKPQSFFTQEDISYILGGTYIKDPQKWLRLFDKGLRK